MFSLLALVASCQPLTEAKTPTPPPDDGKPPPIAEADEKLPEVRIPAGSPIVRECYASNKDTRRRASSTPMPAPPPSSTASYAPTTAAPSGAMGTGTASGGGIGAGGYGAGPGSGNAAPDAVAQAAPAPKASAAATTPTVASSEGAADRTTSRSARASAPAEPEAAAPMAGGDGLADAADDKAPAKPTDSLAKKGKAEEKADAPARDEARRMGGREQQQKEYEAPYVDPNLDWGATVYLSNDDSMSLASAQRLLWAVQNRGPVKTSEVRPHELLNYFSFDTDPVEKGDLFSVRGSAEETAPGVLTFAFAVKGATPPRKPLDLTMVLDRSGSMSAEGRMTYLKRGLTKMTDQLQRGDRIDLVLFDDQVCTPLENYVVGRDDPSLLADAIQALQPRGSTDLDLGLKEGYRIANARTDAGDRNRRMMLISDALLNTGDVNPNTVSEIAKAYEESDIRLTAIGVGRDFNDKVLDMLTEKGKGAYVYLGSEAVVDRVFGIGFPSLVQTIAHDVRFALDLPPSLAMKRFYGEESSTNPDDVQPINYYAGTTQLFLQDLQLRGKPVPSDPVTLTVEWKDADDGHARTQSFTTTVGALLDSDPRNMRKGRALMAWTDMILERSMGGSPCGQAFSTWRERVDRLGEDAEIQWLDGLTSPLCGATPVTPRAPASGVAFEVKVDSDLPIAEVGLTCNGRTQTESLSGSDSVARFASATPGGCTLMLQGNVPMQAAVEVPTTGGEVRCRVRGGRVSCG